jgi:hypothetical protein
MPRTGTKSNNIKTLKAKDSPKGNENISKSKENSFKNISNKSPKKSPKVHKLSKIDVEKKNTKHTKLIDIPDEEISTPEIEEIREKLKQKLRPSEKMRLGRQKREAIKKEKIRLGIYVESESDSDDDDIDLNAVATDLDIINETDDEENNIDINVNGKDNKNLNNAINTLVKNSLDMQKNPNGNKDNMSKIMSSVNEIIDSVMSNVMNKTNGGNNIPDTTNNKVNIYVKNGPNEEPKPIESFDFNVDFNENFKNFMNKKESDTNNDNNNLMMNSNKDKQQANKLNNQTESDNDNTKMGSKRPKRINLRHNLKKNQENEEQENNHNKKIQDKGKTCTNFKNTMTQYLESIYDSEDDMDFDALAKKKEAEENGVNLSELLTYDDDEEIEENTIELDLSNPDFDNFRSLIDACEDYEKLINALNISIKDQAIRERNIQYISRRLKNLVSKIVVKEVKDCQKKDKPKKNNVKGGINNLFSITPRLCKLLGYPKGTKKAWTIVTRDVWKYIRDNGLRDPDNSAMVIPNEELKKCLGIKKDIIRQLDVTSYIGAAIKGGIKSDTMLSNLDSNPDDDLEIELKQSNNKYKNVINNEDNDQNENENEKDNDLNKDEEDEEDEDDEDEEHNDEEHNDEDEEDEDEEDDDEDDDEDDQDDNLQDLEIDKDEVSDSDDDKLETEKLSSSKSNRYKLKK